VIRVNENEVPWRDGMTVQDCLDAMGYDFVHITVTVDDVFVESIRYRTTRVPDGADVRAIHLYHGG
jgi:thiamine biosynthesis protein ThiS